MSLSLPVMGESVSPFVRDLRAAVRGQVLHTPSGRGLYAQDASHYQIMPQAAFVPMDEADVLAAIAVCRTHRVAITARGGGTSLSGQTFGPGLVIDFSKHVDKVLEINAAEGWARVQPGMVRDRLNEQLKPYGLHFAPDPATGRVATVGGMIGNNSSGTRSIRFGKTIDSVLALRVALLDGTVLDCRPTDADQWRTIEAAGGRSGEVYRGVRELIEAHADAIREVFPKVLRRVSGYNLDAFVDGAGYTGPIGHHRPAGEWSLADLIVGSEGTLGVLLEATLRLEALPKATAICVVHFDDLVDSLRPVPQMLEHGPTAVELLDRVVLAEASVNPATSDKAVFLWPDAGLASSRNGPRKSAQVPENEAAELSDQQPAPRAMPAAMQIVEFFAQTPAEAAAKAHAFAAAMREAHIGSATVVRTDPTQITAVWDTRKLGLGLISNVPGRTKGIEFVEDACVPVEHLADYIARLLVLFDELGITAGVYAHASVGVLHVRPMLNAHTQEGRATMRVIAERAFEWVQHYGGAFAGEHGDGIVRGEFVPRTFGPEVYAAFQSIKRIFDPDGLLNPGKIVDTRRMDDPQVHRYGDGYHPIDPPMLFRHHTQGGFVQAVEQCNGVGACRKLDAGTMCPSYMATRDERDVTRGRANVLRLAMSGQLGTDPITALAGDEVHDVLSLCLSCKACKQECPNAVDMARLKSDVQQIRHDQHGVPMGARLVGAMPELARRFAGKLSFAWNLPPKLPGARWAMEKLTGIDRRRPLPRLANRILPGTRSANVQGDSSNTNQVVLFLDTYASCYEPHVGDAAIKLLADAGFSVHVADVGCCQRPRLSKGLVREARRRGEQMMRKLDEILPNAPILCLEPSCASSLADDLPDLIDDVALGRRIADRVRLLESFLVERGVRIRSTAGHVLLHGHCHQKALFGTSALHELMGEQLTEINSGCCGMAGSFGYEHHDLSGQIGEDRLFPAVRAAAARGQTVIAPGISCRHQLHDWLGVTARHPVEVMEVADRQRAS